MGDFSLPVNSSPPFATVPPEAAGIDINFCKNPRCANFGVPARLVKWRRKTGSPLATTPGTAYGLSRAGNNRPALKCLLCGEIFSLKSNLAVAEEVIRFADYLLPHQPPSCPDPGCANHGNPVGTKGAYHRFGVSNAGTPRWRCRVCGKTFARGGRPMKRQRITHLNKAVLLALTNKMPIRRIRKVTGLATGTLYGKINYLYQQCVAYAGSRERALLDMELRRLYISVDRQAYAVNWSKGQDRRNIVLRAVGSSDNDSGYVFGMHLNFDPAMNPVQIEQDAADRRDVELPYPYREYARVWLASDYAEALRESKAERVRRAARARARRSKRTLGDTIADGYDAAAAREDVEVSDQKDEDQRLPESHGMQVHEEYTLYGHFMFLKGLLRRVEKLRFFLDQDSGMRAACLAAFAQDVRMRRVDAFYVRTRKEMTVHHKRALVTKARANFKDFQDAYPTLTPAETQVEMMKAEIANSAAFGKWSDRWCAHPFPTMSEPAKAMCWLTDLGDYDEEHAARLFLKASLHAIDNFFQRVRRSLNPLERPLLTASKHRRTWYGYSPYNPALAGKLLGIYRVMHNFVEVGKDGKTPAMRLGLAQARVTPEDILYFSPPAQQ